MDVISMRDFSKEEIETIVEAAIQVKKAFHGSSDEKKRFEAKYGKVTHLLEGKTIATLFGENSTRTNFSSRAAVLKAGARVDGFPSDAYTSLQKGETWGHTAGMFAGYGFEAAVLRSRVEGLPRLVTELLEEEHELMIEQQARLGYNNYSFNRPVIINGGDGKNQHPTQCFLDLMTITELSNMLDIPMTEMKVALTNDIAHSRVQSSNMTAAQKLGFQVHFAYPPRFGPREFQLEDLRRHGVRYYDHGQDLSRALREAHVACHSRPQKERVAPGEDLRTIKEWGMIDIDLYRKLGKNAPYLMHPLPVDSETFEEIHYTMDRHPLNWTKVQAANGLYMRIALFAIGQGRINIGCGTGKNDIEPDEVSLEELSLTENKKSNAELRSGYIKGDGIVIDHIPAGKARRLAGILGLESENIPLSITQYLPVRDGRCPEKDMMKVHQQYEPSQKQYEAMALMDPNLTVSIVKSGRVVRKVRPKLGISIENRVTCVNNACVTNVRKEHVNPKHDIELVAGETILRCRHCEVPDKLDNVYEQQRFRYIGRTK